MLSQNQQLFFENDVHILEQIVGVQNEYFRSMTSKLQLNENITFTFLSFHNQSYLTFFSNHRIEVLSSITNFSYQSTLEKTTPQLTQLTIFVLLMLFIKITTIS